MSTTDRIAFFLMAVALGCTFALHFINIGIRDEQTEAIKILNERVLELDSNIELLEEYSYKLEEYIDKVHQLNQ